MSVLNLLTWSQVRASPLFVINMKGHHMAHIKTTQAEHGFFLTAGYLNVFIDNRERFFTVWNVLTDKPVATITRPMVIDRRGQWEASATDGSLISKAIGPRNAFRAVINHLTYLDQD